MTFLSLYKNINNKVRQKTYCKHYDNPKNLVELIENIKYLSIFALYVPMLILVFTLYWHSIVFASSLPLNAIQKIVAISFLMLLYEYYIICDLISWGRQQNRYVDETYGWQNEIENFDLGYED